MAFDNLQNEIYEALAALAIAALNPGWSYDTTAERWTNGTLVQNAPPIPVIQDMQDDGAPTTGPYLTIQQTPIMEKIGLGPNSSQQDNAGNRVLTQGYTAHVKIQESNSTGDLILRVQNFYETDAGQAILDNTHVSIMDFGEVKEFSMILDGRWFTQIQSEIVCTIASTTLDGLSYIATMNATGTLN